MPFLDVINQENMPKFGMKSGNVTLGHLGNLVSRGDLKESASHHLGQRYLGSKGVRETRQEDGVLGSLAAGHREESASHHKTRAQTN